MYTPEALLDLHERAHRSLSKLLVHCGQFSADELKLELAGFGYPCIRLQLHHMIGAEEYWIGVLRGLTLVDEREEDFASIEALGVYRARVAATTEDYLRSASTHDLNTARTMITWGDKERILAPAHVLLRTQTHIYQHQGQVVAMCRLLGKPASGMDFPLS